MTTEKFDPFVTEWLSFSQDPKYNLIEKCLKLAQILDYPELNITDYIEKIARERFMMVKPGEKVFRVIEFKSAQ